MPRSLVATIWVLTATAAASLPDDLHAAESTSTSSIAARAGRKSGLDPNRLEFGVLPAVNYNSDLGVGVGVLGTLAKFSEGYNPFDWRVEALVFFSLRDQGNGLEAPLHSHYVDFDKPGLVKGNLRLNARISFTKQANAGYYGLGSNAPDEKQPTDPERLTQFDRIHPELAGTARIRLWSKPVSVGKRRLELLAGMRFRYTWYEFYEGSRLALDRRQIQEGGELADLLRGLDDHALWTLYTGLLWDTRDREFDTQQGGFHEISVRASPGVDESLEFVGVSLISRWFTRLGTDRLAFASRTVADLLVGDIPLYELGLFGGLEPTAGPGGTRSVRGVPLLRFYGKVKLIQSLELRLRIAPFRVAKQRFTFGAVAFGDVGRVWGDYSNTTIEVRQADGTVDLRRLDGAGFEVGLGGGLRLRWGETFVIRADVGYAPTLDTTGFYIDVGDAF